MPGASGRSIVRQRDMLDADAGARWHAVLRVYTLRLVLGPKVRLQEDVAVVDVCEREVCFVCRREAWGNVGPR